MERDTIMMGTGRRRWNGVFRFALLGGRFSDDDFYGWTESIPITHRIRMYLVIALK